ncbi:UNVERIFIED_CONTAM: hypothetical protein OHV15_01905 [Microbacterium sp. SLM126]
MWGAVGGLVAIAGLIVGWLAWVNPNPGQQPSSMEDRQPYIHTVDALCRQAMEANVGLPQTGLTNEEYAEASAHVADTYAQLLVEWAAVPLPHENDATLIRPMLDSLEAMVDSSREVSEWVSINEIDKAADEYERIREYADALRSTARAYGFEICHDLGPR